MIDAIEPHVSRQGWALVQLQLLTAARSGELVIMRPADVDRSGKIWTYTPTDHKNAFREQGRTIYIGPRAQRVLGPFLLRDAGAYSFSPAEAEAERLAALHAVRTTPLSRGNRPGTNRRPRPRKRPGAAYTPDTYARTPTFSTAPGPSSRG